MQHFLTMVLTTEFKTAEKYLQMLYALSKEARLYVLSKLSDSLLQDEIKENVPGPRRKAKVLHRSTSSSVTDEELEGVFASEDMPDYPKTEPSWDEVIKANSGKTIKSIEKWL